MGTNFYVGKRHIGKRSAAGPYCWDCGITLCKDGNEGIHTSGNDRFFSECPICGKKPIAEGLFDGSAGRELGFNKSSPKAKTGVASCSSFTWAILPKDIKRGKIRDEYGSIYTRDQFEDVLRECPVMYFSSIGKEFS